MFRILLPNLIQAWIGNKEETHSSFYVAELFHVIGALSLFIANYLYFYQNNDSRVGICIIVALLISIFVLIIKVISYWSEHRKRKKSLIMLEGFKNKLAETIQNQFITQLSPKTIIKCINIIIKVLPASLFIWVIYYIVKQKTLASFSKKIKKKM